MTAGLATPLTNVQVAPFAYFPAFKLSYAPASGNATVAVEPVHVKLTVSVPL